MKEKLLKAIRWVAYVNAAAVTVEVLILTYRAPHLLPSWLHWVWNAEIFFVALALFALRRAIRKERAAQIAQVRAEVERISSEQEWVASMLDGRSGHAARRRPRHQDMGSRVPLRPPSASCRSQAPSRALSDHSGCR